MKKLFNILIIMLLLIIPVSADEESGGGLSEDSLSTEIYLDLNEYGNGTENYAVYSWSIPASITFTNIDKDSVIGKIKNNVAMNYSAQINIKLSENQNFYIKNSDNVERSIEVYVDGEKKNAGDIISVVCGGAFNNGSTSNTETKEITFKLLSADKLYSGTYSGTVAFTASIFTNISGGGSN